MKFPPVLGVVLVASAVGGPMVAVTSHAQTYPTKPIRLITPFPPGGSTDTLARIFAQNLTEVLGEQVIVDNRGGAGGTIGVGLAARAAPDGYTIVIAHVGPLAVAPTLYSKLPYDPTKDFAPISLLATVPAGMVVHPSLPVRSIKDLIALARAKPKQILYASGGSGSFSHLAIVYFELLTKVELGHIPYKGSGPAIIDLIAGRISLHMTGILGLMPHIKSGKLRLLAVDTAKRLAVMPDVATMAEAGVPGYETTQWQGILAPATPSRDIVAKLNAAIIKVLHRPDLKERLAATGVQPLGSTPEEFGAHIKAEIARWAPVVNASGARL